MIKDSLDEIKKTMQEQKFASTGRNYSEDSDSDQRDEEYPVRSRDGYNNIICYYCQYEGHVIANCRKRMFNNAKQWEDTDKNNLVQSQYSQD